MELLDSSQWQADHIFMVLTCNWFFNLEPGGKLRYDVWLIQKNSTVFGRD
jgi:hypothetical protein